MSDKPLNRNELAVFGNRHELATSATTEFAESLRGRKACILLISDNANQGDKAFEFPDLGWVKRMVVVFTGRPVHLKTIESWRDWATDKMPGLLDLRMAFVVEHQTKDVLNAVRTTCVEWFAERTAPEGVGLERRTWVRMPDEITAKDDPSLLTMMFGSMGKLLTGLEVAARSFKSAVGSRSHGAEREAYLRRINELLARGGPQTKSGATATSKPSAKSAKPDLGLGNITDRIPKVLLLGDTGVGKTLIASYLHKRSGLLDSPLHISIPEFIGKEDMLEYKLFGYAAGNYTGGKPEGDHGLLLENVGRVVFLDEIGEANAEIQAKLLTFLDHFYVRPRGWLEDPFYCPVLIVAATNRNLHEKTRRGMRLFRNDLFRRFTDVLPIPPLRERKQDFEFILDCLLQRESLNPGGFITQIGTETLAFLKKNDFEKGNFRELEDLFRNACRTANKEDRPYLVRSDFEQKTMLEAASG